MEPSDIFHRASPYGERNEAKVSSVDDFGMVKKWQPSSRAVPTRTPDHLQGSTIVADSNENHYGRKWKKMIDPGDQLAVGRYEGPPGGVAGSKKRAELEGKEDAPREALFGPSGDLADMAKLSLSTERPRTGVRQCHMYADQSQSSPGGVNGILAGAGEAEIPWKTKRHIEPRTSGHLEKPAALATDGHGHISWDSPERRKVQGRAQYAQMDAPLESYRTTRKQVPSAHGTATRLIFQDMDDTVQHTPLRRPLTTRAEGPATVFAVSFREKDPNASPPKAPGPGARVNHSQAFSGAGMQPNQTHARTDSWESHTPTRKRFDDQSPFHGTARGVAGAPYGLQSTRP